MDAMQLMRQWFPAWSDEQRHDVLWNCTAYPCGGRDYVTEQLRELKEKASQGKTADELIAEAERELEEAMKEHA